MSSLTKFWFMPKFTDVHKMNPLTEQQIKQAQNAAKDEFGVTHENMIYSEADNKVFCVLNAPNKEAVEKHHRKIGLKPDGYTKLRLQSNHPVRNPSSFLYQLPVCMAVQALNI